MFSLFNRTKDADKFAYSAHERHRRPMFAAWKKLPLETRAFNEDQYDRWLDSVKKDMGGHYPVLNRARGLPLGRPVSGLDPFGSLARLFRVPVLYMDGAFYGDLREPHIMSDVAAVTLSTTNKALYPVGAFPFLGGQYFARPGKKIGIRVFGRITTAVTPGNGTFAVLYGTGADANGVSVQVSTTSTLVASQTSLSWHAEIFVHCRSTGSAGTMFCTGDALYNPSVVAAHHAQFPASAPAVSGACDLTAANILSLQYNRSGSTVETMQVHDMEVFALN